GKKLRVVRCTADAVKAAVFHDFRTYGEDAREHPREREEASWDIPEDSAPPWRPNRALPKGGLGQPQGGATKLVLESVLLGRVAGELASGRAVGAAQASILKYIHEGWIPRDALRTLARSAEGTVSDLLGTAVSHQVPQDPPQSSPSSEPTPRTAATTQCVSTSPYSPVLPHSPTTLHSPLARHFTRGGGTATRGAAGSTGSPVAQRSAFRSFDDTPQHQASGSAPHSPNAPGHFSRGGNVAADPMGSPVAQRHGEQRSAFSTFDDPPQHPVSAPRSPIASGHFSRGGNVAAEPMGSPVAQRHGEQRNAFSTFDGTPQHPVSAPRSPIAPGPFSHGVNAAAYPMGSSVAQRHGEQRRAFSTLDDAPQHQASGSVSVLHTPAAPDLHAHPHTSLRNAEFPGNSSPGAPADSQSRRQAQDAPPVVGPAPPPLPPKDDEARRSNSRFVFVRPTSGDSRITPTPPSAGSQPTPSLPNGAPPVSPPERPFPCSPPNDDELRRNSFSGRVASGNSLAPSAGGQPAAAHTRSPPVSPPERPFPRSPPKDDELRRNSFSGRPASGRSRLTPTPPSAAAPPAAAPTSCLKLSVLGPTSSSLAAPAAGPSKSLRTSRVSSPPPGPPLAGATTPRSAEVPFSDAVRRVGTGVVGGGGRRERRRPRPRSAHSRVCVTSAGKEQPKVAPSFGHLYVAALRAPVPVPLTPPPRARRSSIANKKQAVEVRRLRFAKVLFGS
ncbi:hypothetical protein DIPPA_03029, partial [Diplonema papillatum]